MLAFTLLCAWRFECASYFSACCVFASAVSTLALATALLASWSLLKSPGLNLVTKRFDSALLAPRLSQSERSSASYSHLCTTQHTAKCSRLPSFKIRQRPPCLATWRWRYLFVVCLLGWLALSIAATRKMLFQVSTLPLATCGAFWVLASC